MCGVWPPFIEPGDLRRWAMKLVTGICFCWAISAAAQTIQPRIVSKPAVDGEVNAVEVQAHFVTAIRMPEPVNSVAVGDPALFQVEHSEREPRLVFVKALTNQPARGWWHACKPRPLSGLGPGGGRDGIPL